MFNLAIGVILLIQSYIDYYVMKPEKRDAGSIFRFIMIILGLLNILSFCVTSTILK